MRATRLLHEAAGRPSPRKTEREAEGSCYWCGRGLDGRACRVRDVCGPNFTDHDVAEAPWSPWVCPACTWTMTGRPPDTLRMWSLLYREDRPAAPSHPSAPDLGPRIHLQSKGDPSEFLRALLDPPAGRWVLSLADSGQLHVVPFAVVNESRETWTVRLERDDVVCPAARFREMHSRVRELLDLGFSKTEIEADAPRSDRLMEHAEAWRRAERVLSPERGGAALALLLFLIRKEPLT